MHRLKELTILRFRDVEPNTRVCFADGINVLLGKNGTGKTTLLELVAAIVRLDMSYFSYDEADVSFKMTEAVKGAQIDGKIVSSAVESTSSSRVSARMRTSSANNVSLMLAITTEERTTNIRYENGLVHIDDAPPVGVPTTVPFTEALDYVAHSIKKNIGVSLARLASAVRFDESLGYLDHLNEIQLAYYEKYRFMVDVGPRALPDNVRQALEVGARDTKNTRQIYVDLGANTTMARAAKQIEALHVGVSFSLINETPAAEDRGRVRTYGRPNVFVRFHDRGLDFSALSFGQKRMILLFWCLANNAEIAIVDEPINGLHHAWIEAAVDELKNSRQSFVTSQNPLLLDHLTFDSREDVERTFIQCTQEWMGKGRKRTKTWMWKNTAGSVADRFYEAYEQKFRHVGEILLDQGLW